MTDRELLELAAKAAGHCIVWGEVHRVGDTDVDCTDLAYVVSNDREESPYYWNPREDDGDALRLAVKLRLCLIPLSDGGWDVERYNEHGEGVTLASCAKGDDAAVRECIVRAAAEIGKDPA